MKYVLILISIVMFLDAHKVMAATNITAPCDSTTHQSQWFEVGADDGGDFIISAGSAPGGESCNIQTTSWNRDHWTMTCWVTSSSSNQTSYTCHNWNTVFGDAWKISFSYMACPQSGCVTSEKEKAMIKNIDNNLKQENYNLMRSNAGKQH